MGDLSTVGGLNEEIWKLRCEKKELEGENELLKQLARVSCVEFLPFEACIH